MAVKVGFIGVGGMAEHHIKTLRKVEHAELTAVYDINQERARSVVETYGGTAYESSEQLLDSGQVDALFVCTPPFARGNIEEEAARRGIHMLLEKPVGLDMKEVRRKEQIIRESGVIHSSGYCLRYMEIVEQAKKYLASKKIDMVLSVRLAGLPGVRWWRIMEQSGGQLVEQSTHQLDLIRYLAGDIKQVNAVHGHRHIHLIHPDATAYDVGTVSFVFDSGAVGNITSSCMIKYGSRSGTEFFGSDFYVNISGSTLQIIDAEQNITVKSENDMYLSQDTAFIEAVRTGNRELVLCDFSEAATTLAVTLAANEAAASSETIIL